MKKVDKTIGSILAGIAILVIGLVALTLNPRPEVNTYVAGPVANSSTLLAAVNTERVKSGAQPLIDDPRLDASAQAKACDEYNNHYFGHISPNGVQGYKTAETALNAAPGNYSENLTQPTPTTTTQAMQNWDNSQPHHNAMINTHYTLTGFGICGNEVVEHFYSPIAF